MLEKSLDNIDRYDKIINHSHFICTKCKKVIDFEYNFKIESLRKQLKPNQEPKDCFSLCEGDEVEAVYAYCNLHGLWVNK